MQVILEILLKHRRRVDFVIFVCREENDLYRVLKDSGYTYPIYSNIDDALEEAPTGSAVLILADDYPRASHRWNYDLLHAALSKALRLYIEYPASLPDLEIGEPRPTEWERVVVSSEFFAPALEKYTILALHGCWFLPVKVESPHLVAARVAGYYKAVYGLPAETFPILFELPGKDIMVATSKLSQFVTGRYGPTKAWKSVWMRLIRWLTRSKEAPTFGWTPVVDVQSSRDERLPETAEMDAFNRSVKWFRENIVYSIDWKKGAIEGFESPIDHEGRQMRRPVIRSDCIAETGMVFANDWVVNRNPSSRWLARQILDYVWSAPDFLQDDPESPAYGLINWFERGPIFYGDDNARVVLSTLAASRLLGEGRWYQHLLRCLLANLRTTGQLGFRRRRLEFPSSFSNGRSWEYYRDERVVDYAPHYQAYLWAAFLWAYALTGYDGFLEKTRNAIEMTMDAYPKWRWTNGLTQEMARMLLPLSFLVRIEDTSEHRRWINVIAEDLIAQMQPCGAIQEKLGPLEDGTYPPPSSNEEYGTRESSIIQENGDPACDLTYTVNFAFLGLHEAAAATGDKKLKRAEDRLAEFLCRVQVRSTVHPYLDGAWMRSFDYELWEYWGSSADLGWGAWSVESGWTNTWIASVFAMRQRGETLFDLTITDRIKLHLPKLLREMDM